MLSRLHGEDRRRGVPKIGHGNRDRVERLVFERFPKVHQTRWQGLDSGSLGQLDSPFPSPRIDVADIGDFDVWHLGESLDMLTSTAVDTDDSHPVLLFQRILGKDIKGESRGDGTKSKRACSGCF